jgi:hypothetical protein
MGQTCRKLHDKLTKMAAPLDLPTGKMKGRDDMPSVERRNSEGMNPVAVSPSAAGGRRPLRPRQPH